MVFFNVFLPHLLTNRRVLPKDERRHEVSPNPRRLEDEEEDAKILVDDISTLLPLQSRLLVASDGQVGALG